MMPEPTYFRAETFHYALQSHPDYFFFTSVGENAQFLMGSLENLFVLLTFDMDGDFVEIQEERFDVHEQTASQTYSSFMETLSKKVHEVNISHNASEGTLSIKRFALRSLSVGIADLPEDLAAIASSSRDEAKLSGDEDLIEAHEGWIDESLYVFWWAQEYYVEPNGFVESS